MLCHCFNRLFILFFFSKVVSYFRKTGRNNVSRLKLDIELQRKTWSESHCVSVRTVNVILNPQMLKTGDREHVFLVELPRLIYRHTKDSLLIIKDSKTTNSWITLILWLPNRISLGQENKVTLKNTPRFSK